MTTANHLETLITPAMVAKTEKWARGYARKQRLPYCVSVNDLIGAANEGLTKAAIKYDPDNAAGAAFQTYAYTRIMGHMMDYIRTLVGRNGQFMDEAWTLSFSTVATDAEDDKRVLQLTDYNAVSDDDICSEDYAEIILDRLANELTDAEKTVALYVIEGYSNTEIGGFLGVSPSRICQHLASVRKKLNVQLEEAAC